MKKIFLFIIMVSSIFADNLTNQAQEDFNKGNYKSSFERSKKSCDIGDPTGCYYLGVLYTNGKGVNQDDHKGIEFYKKSCDMDNADGCYGIAYFYDKGRSVKQDYHKAVSLYQKSCDLGNTTACVNLAFLYTKTEAITLNYHKSEKLLQKACDEKNALGCGNLGIAYELGLGVKQSFKEAEKLYRKACDLKGATGCYRLGIFYMTGQISKNILGVDIEKEIFGNMFGNDVITNYQSEDMKIAKKLFGKSCDLGLQLGCNKYAKLNKKIN